MKRRIVLATTGAAFSTSLVGCLDESTVGDPENHDSTDGSAPSINREQIVGVNAILVEDAPQNADVVDADDSRIADVKVIQAVLEKAATPDVEKSEGTRASGTYEAVGIDRDDYDEDALYEAAVALEQLPFYDESAEIAPLGWYIHHPEQMVVTTYRGLD